MRLDTKVKKSRISNQDKTQRLKKSRVSILYETQGYLAKISFRHWSLDKIWKSFRELDWTRLEFWEPDSAKVFFWPLFSFFPFVSVSLSLPFMAAAAALVAGSIGSGQHWQWAALAAGSRSFTCWSWTISQQDRFHEEISTYEETTQASYTSHCKEFRLWQIFINLMDK